MKRSRMDMILLGLIGLVALSALIVVIVSISGDKTPTNLPERVQVTTPSVKVEYVEKEKLVQVEVEKTITGQILQDGLRDMGTLITSEYYFTEVVDYSSVKTLSTVFGSLVIPGSESAYTVSYDGVVTAGIDFSGITVVKNEDNKSITIRIPKAEVQNVDIDPLSFCLHYEKQSFMNKTSVADFNDSLIELEATARRKAVDKGLLDRADANGRTVLSNFVRSMVDTSVYTLNILTK